MLCESHTGGRERRRPSPYRSRAVVPDPPFFSDRQSAGGGGPYLRVGEPIAISSWARAICNEPVSRCAHETSSAADLIEFFTLRLEGVYLLRQPPRLLKTEGFEIETSNARTPGPWSGSWGRKPG